MKQTTIFKHILYCTILAILYYGTAKLGLLMAFEQRNVSPVWPPSGLAIAALFLYLRLWPGITIGAFLAAYSTGAPFLIALGIALGNTTEALVAVLLVKRFVGARPLDRSPNIIRFITAAILSAGVGATIGVTILFLAGRTGESAYSNLWKTWCTGDALGILIVGSFFISWKDFISKEFEFRKKLELLLILAGVGSVAVSLFFGWLPPDATRVYGVLPLIVLASYRFQQPGATSTVLLVSAVSIFSTAQGMGPFYETNLNEALLHLQFFLFITSLTALVLASAMAERKEAETALKWSEGKYRTLSENIPCVAYIAEFGDTGRWIYVNHQIKSILGFSEKEIIDDPLLWKRRMHPEDRDHVMRKEQEAQRSGKTFHAEYRIYRRDERMIWVEDEGAVLPGQETPLLYQGIISDITQRKSHEQALVESRQKYENLLNSIDGIVWEANPKTLHFTFVSPQAEHILGWPLESWVTKEDFWKDRIHPEDREQAIALFLKSIKEKKDLVLEYRMIAAGGHSIWMRNIVSVIIDAGEISALRGILIDISMQKQSLEALRKSEERYREFFRDDLTGDFVCSPDGAIIECNPAFARIFDFPDLESACKSNWFSLFANPEETDSFLDSLKQEKTLESLEGRLRTQNGEIIQVIQNILGTFDTDGTLLQIRGYLFDITERKQLELQLLQSQKIEAIGQLAGGVAHDFNNILMAITGYSELLEAQVHDDHPFAVSIGEIRKAAQKGAALTKQLLAFSRKQVLEPKILDVNRVIEEIEHMLRRLIREDIELVLHLEKSTAIKIDPGQLQQILINLTINAQDAMPQGGVLLIQTSNFEMNDEFCRQNLDAKKGDYVLISVTDTGTGMDEEIKLHLFEPFFTTKENGTGLGLANVYGIVKQSGGYISVQSDPGKGTTFRIHLPVTEESVVQTSAVSSQANLASGTKLILLVDDSQPVRESIGAFLELQGFRILLAGEGSEALEIAKKNEIDLLITDMVMPNMSGSQLADVLWSVNPTLKVLFMSGYTEEDAVRSGELSPRTRFISKPASMISIIRKINELLHS